MEFANIVPQHSRIFSGTMGSSTPMSFSKNCFWSYFLLHLNEQINDSGAAGEVNHKLGSIVEEVDANGFPPLETYRTTISDFADQAERLLKYLSHRKAYQVGTSMVECEAVSGFS